MNSINSFRREGAEKSANRKALVGGGYQNTAPTLIIGARRMGAIARPLRGSRPRTRYRRRLFTPGARAIASIVSLPETIASDCGARAQRGNPRRGRAPRATWFRNRRAVWTGSRLSAFWSSTRATSEGKTAFRDSGVPPARRRTADACRDSVRVCTRVAEQTAPSAASAVVIINYYWSAPDAHRPRPDRNANASR